MLSEQEFIKLSKHPRGRSSFEETFLKRLYPQVRPHLKGEFPQEAIEKLFERWDLSENRVVPEQFTEALMYDFERLWNGDRRD